jgi:lysozyme family protein
MIQGSSRFEQSLALVLQHEGGFVQHPRDPGGATNFGITAKPCPGPEDATSPSRTCAISRRRRRLDLPPPLLGPGARDELSPGLDLAVFDLAVHSGPAKAVRMLQDALGIRADGVVGPVTLEAVREADPEAAIRSLTRARLGFLSRLGIWPVFGRGWRRRVLSVEQEALRLASTHHPSQGALTLFDTKSILASRTIWANLIGFAALVLGLFGFDASSLSTGAFEEALVQLIAAGSFVASTVFRIVATKQIMN